MRISLAAIALAIGAAAAPAATLAPLHPLPAGAERAGGYIVVLKNTANVQTVVSRLGLSNLQATYNTVLKGFAGEFNEVTLNAIRADPLVDFVEYDMISSKDIVQRKAPYNLAIDSQGHQLEPEQQNVYKYNTPAAEGVGIYVLDTGINIHNVEFGGRAHNLITYYDTYDDVDGHGTNVAGIAGGTTYGPAKDAAVYNVKVLGDNGKGSNHDIISGLDYSVQHNAKRKAVINMSLDGPFSQAENNAVQAAFNDGLLVAAAAGNKNEDACNKSPASSPYAFTVAAIDGDYRRASFSNWGSCVNIFAPGVDIMSAGASSNNATSNLSGTSQATPGVAGIVAYFLGFRSGLSASQQSELVYQYSMNGLVTDPMGTTNSIANNGFFQGFPG